MEGTRTFKIHFGDDVHRFRLAVSADVDSWSLLQAKAFEICAGDDFTLKWKDVDGDLITISNGEDFVEMLAEQLTDPVRLHAIGIETSDLVVTTPSSAAPSRENSFIEGSSSEAETVSETDTARPKPDAEVVADAEIVAGTETKTKADDEPAAQNDLVQETTLNAETSEIAKPVSSEDEADKQAKADEQARTTAAAATEAVKAAAEAEHAAFEASKLAECAAKRAEAIRIESERKLPVAHPYITCDGSGMSPLRGTRYHKVNYDYDLCEAEFAKLPESEKQLYEIIVRPGAIPIRYEPVIHFGIVCTTTNSGPLVGARFHKIGEDFNLCQVEFAKLDEAEKRQFEIIVHPRSAPVQYYRMPEPTIAIHRIFFPGGYFDFEIVDDSGIDKRQDQDIQNHEIAAGETLPETVPFGIGSYGPGVEQLQEFLICHQLMNPKATSCRAGLFGPWTRRAIARFQSATELDVQELGKFDAITRDALLAHINNEPKPDSKPGSIPEDSNSDERQEDEVVGVQATPATQLAQAKWADELAILTNMGFTDGSLLTNLLERKHGKLDLVVAEMLQ